MDINAADTGRSVCGIPVRGGGNATALPPRIVIGLGGHRYSGWR
ncbi:hypothetical protein ABZ891_30365 [Streptomyces sp. NPDC047023]